MCHKFWHDILIQIVRQRMYWKSIALFEFEWSIFSEGNFHLNQSRTIYSSKIGNSFPAQICRPHSKRYNYQFRNYFTGKYLNKSIKFIYRISCIEIDGFQWIDFNVSYFALKMRTLNNIQNERTCDDGHMVCTLLLWNRR